VNGDGVTDLLIGANGFDRGSFGNMGAAYVIYGKKTPGNEQTWAGLIDDPTQAGRKILDLGNLRTADGFMIEGEETVAGNFGRSVEGVGDVNGDGIDDIVVGAPGALPAGTGSAYVIFGSRDGQGTIANGRQTLSAQTMNPSQGFIIRGVSETGAQLGASVGAAGDVNGDGLADIMVNAPSQDRITGQTTVADVGRSYIILGKNNGEGWGQQSVGGRSILDLTNFGVGDGFSIVGRNVASENLGSTYTGGAIVDSSLISPGDLNGDGRDDLFINVLNADTNGRNNNGAGYFIYSTAAMGGGLSRTGTAAVDTLNGGGLADTINGGGGEDRLRGFAGNDTLIIGDGSFVRVDGGAGTDTLRLAGGSAINLDLSTLATGAIKDIEQIDLVVGSLANTLIVTEQSLLNLSSTSDVLKVFGDNNDQVTATGFANMGSVIENGITYKVYTSGSATLWVQQNVTVQGTTAQPSGYALKGFDGNQTLIVNDANFSLVDGGAGMDTLRLAGAEGFGLNLAAEAITDIEQIDLVAGSLSSTLTVTQQSLLDLSSTSNILTVLGDSGDKVIASGFIAGAQNQRINGTVYDIYTNGLAELWVQDGVVVETTPPAQGWAQQVVIAA
jgi:hypothetical protein